MSQCTPNPVDCHFIWPFLLSRLACQMSLCFGSNSNDFFFQWYMMVKNKSDRDMKMFKSICCILRKHQILLRGKNVVFNVLPANCFQTAHCSLAGLWLGLAMVLETLEHTYVSRCHILWLHQMHWYKCNAREVLNKSLKLHRSRFSYLFSPDSETKKVINVNNSIDKSCGVSTQKKCEFFISQVNKEQI